MDQRIPIVIALFSYLSWYVVFSQMKCQTNTSWQAKCERTCGKTNDTCQSFEIEDCYCREGMLRNRMNGQCVWEQFCPANVTCPGNSSLTVHCEQNCQNKICMGKPNQACHCNAGYYRDLVNRKCVKLKDCVNNKQIRDPIHCKRKLLCEKACGDAICRERIGRKCYCKPGYLRNLENGRCVKFGKCPKRTCSSHLKCERACGDDICLAYKRHCFCMKGYFRNLENMKCVEYNDCKLSNATQTTTNFPNTAQKWTTINAVKVIDGEENIIHAKPFIIIINKYSSNTTWISKPKWTKTREIYKIP